MAPRRPADAVTRSPAPAALPAPAGIDALQVPPSHNTEHYARLQGLVETIKSHELFTGIELDEPLEISMGGSQEPFSEVKCKAALVGPSKMYTCGINLFWCDPLWAPAMGVPIRHTAVDYLQDHYFARPTSMPHVLSIAWEDEAARPPRGSWKSLTPEELMHAMLGAIARDVSRGDPNVLAAWKRLALSTTAELRVFSSPGARLNRAMQLRENLAGDDEAMTRTTMQRIYEIASLRQLQVHRGEGSSAAKIAELYKALRTKDPIGASFIDIALTLHNRVLSNPAAERLLLVMDGRPKTANPFNSVNKLQLILNRAHKDEQLLLWFLHAIAHMVLHLNVPADHTDLTIHGLTGKNREPGSKGTLDLLLFKYEALQFFFSKLAISLELDQGGEWLIQSRAHYQNHESYYSSHSSEALPWRRGMNEAQLAFIKFAEEVIYGTRYDLAIKAMLRSNRSAHQIEQDKDGFDEPIQEIKNLRLSALKAQEKDKLQALEDANVDADDEDPSRGPGPGLLDRGRRLRGARPPETDASCLEGAGPGNQERVPAG